MALARSRRRIWMDSLRGWVLQSTMIGPCYQLPRTPRNLYEV